VKQGADELDARDACVDVAGAQRFGFDLDRVAEGPGFSIPMGLLMAGVCIPAAVQKLLPKWLVAFGLLLAVAGELSWFNLVFPKVLFLIPPVSFPGFIWLIATGFMLPRTVSRPLPATAVPA
jgi:hypothetical protein